MRAFLLGCFLVLASPAFALAQQNEPPPASTQIDRSRQTAITRAVQTVSPAVVTINVIEVRRVRSPFSGFENDPFFRFFFEQMPRSREQRVEAIGSGFVISSDGYIVTNEHVVSDATEIEVQFPDGRALPARLVGSDAPSDLALLKVDTEATLPHLSFASAPPVVGEWVIAFGNPFGLFEAADPTVTVGVVSAVGRNLQRTSRSSHLYRDMIQTDASINQGNSGGPLVNALGDVIGVNTAIYSESGGSVGIGFAVPAHKVRRVVDELRRTGRVDRSYYTGLYVATLTPRIAHALGLDRARGVIVRNLDPDSPAAEAGLQPYDVIVAIEGERIDSQEDYVARMYDFRPGDRVRLRLLRDGREITTTMRIGRQSG